MIFGVFDCLHPGHIFFIKQASELGNLVIVVARDEAVEEIKNKSSIESQKERIRKVRVLKLGKAVLGDRRKGSYKIIKKCRPDFICLGYDQKRLKKDLEIKIKGKKLPKMVLKTLRYLPGPKNPSCSGLTRKKL